MTNLAVTYTPYPKVQCFSQDIGLSVLFWVVQRFGWELEETQGLRAALDLLSNCKCIR